MNTAYVLAGAVLAIFLLGFAMPFTNDYSKFLNFITFRNQSSLLHILVGVIAGVLVYPEDLSWEKDRQYLYTIRCVLGVAIIVAYTIRNFKHVNNLKKKLSGSMFETNFSFWNSSYTKQQMQLFLGVAMGSTAFMVAGSEKNILVPATSMSAFAVLLLLQQTLNTATERSSVIALLKQKKK
tara:strand:- start:46 stop:588 length:543 start_codon:yes stop_codon:yes gene_type:complete